VTTTTATTTTATRITGWDRAVVILLGGAGCLLSYDALRQMALVIHVRPELSWLFPLVIDGFISYGVRALLVLRNAPLASRLYVWTLFGAATATSIWANALHAVTLNQEDSAAGGLKLSDLVVAALSVVAPLALAGAVHLYILIARTSATATVRTNDRDGRTDLGGQPPTGHSTVTSAKSVSDTDPAGQVTPAEPVTGLTGQHHLALTEPLVAIREPAPDIEVSGDQVSVDPVSGDRDSEAQAADQAGHLATTPEVSDLEQVTATVTTAPVAPETTGDGQVTDTPVADLKVGLPVTGDRQPDPDTEALLDIAREAVSAQDKLTRKVVAQAIRGQQIPLSSATLTELMAELREQHSRPVTPARS